jgi:penicillin amidase
LDAPGLQAIGAGEPALPGVSIGHNGHIAFGLTIFSIDQEDLYVYEAREPLQYAYQGVWEQMSVVREVIGVRDAADVEVELRFTRHGPVIYEDREAGAAFALRAAWLEPGMAPYLGSIEYMRARNWDQFLAAMNRWGAPSENQVYADVEGNIGWKPGGLAPIRPNWDGLLPVPGSGAYEWAGFLDMEQLPVEYNPPRGWVATANHMNLPPNYPLQLGWEWRAPFRFDRIAEVLEAIPALSIDDSLRLQTDYLSLPARRLVRVVADLESGVGESAAAQRLLVGWDATLDVDSAPGALFEVWFRCCLRTAVVHEIAVQWDALTAEAAAALGGLHTHHLLSLMEDPDSRLGPQPVATRDRLLRETLSAAFAETARLLGSDPEAWRWGDLHGIELRHLLSEHMPEDLRKLADVGPHERGGSGDTPGSTGYGYPGFRQVSGASFRVVLDVGEWDNSIAMNNPGQSGDPRSKHYDDLFEPWAADRAFPLLWSREKIEAAAETRFRLVPAAP